MNCYDKRAAEGMARDWVRVTLNPEKGQTPETLRAVFKEIGFDTSRPRSDYGDFGAGISLYEGAKGTTVYINRYEVQGLSERGYNLSFVSGPEPAPGYGD